MNFIGAFTVPIDIVTPVELQEQQRREDERLARVKRLQEGYRAKYEKKKAAMQDYYARKRAGLLTPEEQEAEELRLAKRREYNNAYRAKRQAEMPPKPPKPKKLSLKEIGERRREGLPLTPEEIERHDTYKARKNAQFKKWRTRKKAEAPPKPPKERKPTKKQRMKEIGTRIAAGLSVTHEEQETYNAYTEKQRTYAREWQAQHRAKNLGHIPRTGPNLEDIKRRRRDGLPLTPEETAVYDAWRAKKSDYQREWREKNEGYHREYSRKRYRSKKVEISDAVGQ